MIGRLLVGAGLFALGYYLGREVKRFDPLREELRNARENEDTTPEPGAPRPEAPESHADPSDRG
jgi:hypothetical protein